MENQYYTLMEKQDFFEIIENKYGELAVFIDARDGAPQEPVLEFDGKKTAPAIVHVIHKEQGRVVLEMILHEGKNREIRKMCEAVGLEVARLKRTQIGGVKMGMLKQGDWRDLTENEVKKLLSNPIVNGRTI